MLYAIGKRLLNEWVGWLAGFFYALYPYLVFQNLTLIDTPLFIAQLHAFVLIMILLREREQRDRLTWALALLGGLVLGVSASPRHPAAAGGASLACGSCCAARLAMRFCACCRLRSSPARAAALGCAQSGGFGAFVPVSITSGSIFYQATTPT